MTSKEPITGQTRWGDIDRLGHVNHIRVTENFWEFRASLLTARDEDGPDEAAGAVSTDLPQIVDHTPSARPRHRPPSARCLCT
ncbi:hypothetical protein ACFY7C_00465 [Streptomyces sp. NPDC012769]|uniref:hypothetical protein n=1 Tax=Streptomyces sp. NPDC012769 TaxID=3364848 RepID=UPI0036B7DA5B